MNVVFHKSSNDVPSQLSSLQNRNSKAVCWVVRTLRYLNSVLSAQSALTVGSERSQVRRRSAVSRIQFVASRPRNINHHHLKHQQHVKQQRVPPTPSCFGLVVQLIVWKLFVGFLPSGSRNSVLAILYKKEEFF